MFEAMIATVSSRPMPSFDIAIGIAAELIVTMPIGQAFANIRREFPGSDHRAIGWGFAGLDGFQHFVVTQHTGLPGVHPLTRVGSDLGIPLSRFGRHYSTVRLANGY